MQAAEQITAKIDFHEGKFFTVKSTVNASWLGGGFHDRLLGAQLEYPLAEITQRAREAARAS